MSSSQQHDNDPMKPSGLVNPHRYRLPGWSKTMSLSKLDLFGLDIHNRVFCNFRPSRHLVRRHHAHFSREQAEPLFSSTRGLVNWEFRLVSLSALPTSSLFSVWYTYFYPRWAKVRLGGH